MGLWGELYPVFGEINFATDAVLQQSIVYFCTGTFLCVIERRPKYLVKI